MTPTERTISDRLDHCAEGWRPEVGDKVIGTIVELDETDGGFGTYPVVTILTDEGDEVAVHGFHTVLKNELAKKRPKVGDRIGISYGGKAKGKSYERYRVILEQDRSELDWERIESESQADLERETGTSARPETDDDDVPFDETESSS